MLQCSLQLSLQGAPSLSGIAQFVLAGCLIYTGSHKPGVYPISGQCRLYYSILDTLGTQTDVRNICIALGLNIQTSALDHHSLEMDHEVCLGSATVFYRSSGFWDQTIIEILLEDWTLNRDAGLQFNSSSKAALARLQN